MKMWFIYRIGEMWEKCYLSDMKRAYKKKHTKKSSSDYGKSFSKRMRRYIDRYDKGDC